jgi:hypothetical protein
MMIMFTSGTTAALFTIAIISLFLVVSSGFVGSAFAVTKKVKQQHGTYPTVPFSGLLNLSNEDKSVSKKSHSEDAGDFGWSMEDSSTNVWRDICNT